MKKLLLSSLVICSLTPTIRAAQVSADPNILVVINEHINWAEQIIPQHIAGQRRADMRTKMMQGWISGAARKPVALFDPNNLLASPCSIEQMFTPVSSEQNKFKSMLYMPSICAVVSDTSPQGYAAYANKFCEMLPFSCWQKVNLSLEPNFMPAQIEQMQKAWIDEHRNINNFVLPAPSASASASAVSTASPASVSASTHASSNKDQKS